MSQMHVESRLEGIYVVCMLSMSTREAFGNRMTSKDSNGNDQSPEADGNIQDGMQLFASILRTHAGPLLTFHTTIAESVRDPQPTHDIVYIFTEARIQSDFPRQRQHPKS